MHTCTPTPPVTAGHELERLELAAVGEDRLPAAEDHRHDDQPELVDQPFAQQGTNEGRAPHHDEVATICVVELL